MNLKGAGHGAPANGGDVLFARGASSPETTRQPDSLPATQRREGTVAVLFDFRGMSRKTTLFSEWEENCFHGVPE